ncbi:MAG TPA: sigma-70 family RNA polymerase sigma factor [Flavipsychrobacter sp.]|jgi:RNA polymerase sigma-70 factor (ECF subfamily)|nr:sigma-70 family RNA polymerase sigma factor [Chitinophagales bacterium]HLO70857.1 sigma-70 family RNA polymerase sigma factor [Flavipsychrobacter sp.]
MQLIQQCSDSELVHAFILGDEKALETLVYRYKDKIYTSIYMLVKDKYMAEDIFQDAFLKMVRTMREGRYSEQGKFLPWAIRVAHNLCMDHFRKVKQNVQILLPDGKDISDLLGADTQGASDRIETRQVNQSIRQLIEELPEEQREVIVLRMYGDLSFKEIADMTNVSINTALGRMRYGLINLRKMIQDKQMVLR